MLTPVGLLPAALIGIDIGKLLEGAARERELVFIRMAQARAHVDEAMRFADSIVPPDELKSQHARRKFAYSLVYEAMVTALSYLDLGGEDMLNRARKRHDEAVAEFERLSGGR